MWLFTLLSPFLYIASVLAILGIVLSNFIPTKYESTFKIVMIMLLAFSSYSIGVNDNEAKWKSEVQKQKLEIAELKAKSGQVTVKTITKYVDNVTNVKETNNEIIKQIDVIKPNDNQCNVPNAFRLLHDAAAKNRLPDSTGNSNEAPSGIELSTITETVVSNYGICHQNSEQLKALQNWIIEQQKLYK